jgi:hypothetical protein
MKLSELNHSVVFEIVRQAHDIEQIYTLHGHRNPFVITNNVMAAANFAWVAWADDKPTTVFGAVPIHAGVWSTFLLTTPDFKKLAIPLTRFAKRTVVPTLFEKIGAHRLEAVLHEKNTHIHRWVEALGARKEFVKERYAPDGSAYYGYVLHNQSTKPTD